MRSARTLIITGSIALGGCAAGPSYYWSATAAATLSLQQATDRCDYETSAATQSTDYSFRTSFGQELDRAMRKDALMIKCMRAQGFQQVSIAPGKKLEDSPHWKVLESDWEASIARRKAVAAQASNETDPSKREELKEEVKSLNSRIRDLERKLSYAPSAPVTLD